MIENWQRYGGTPGTDDPGYVSAHYVRADGRAFIFYCRPDGANVRAAISERTATGKWRRLSLARAAKLAPEIERAAIEHARHAPPAV